MAKYKSDIPYEPYVAAVKPVPEWYKHFNFILVESMDELRKPFENVKDGEYFMAFDTETTDLDPEKLDLVGYSFCLDGKNTYYVPVNHFEYEHNLGEEAVAFIYEKMCKAKRVFFYNARFDMRVMEYYGYKERKEELDKQRWLYAKFDMSKVSMYDVACGVWLADTNIKFPSLKWASLHFLGFDQMHFEEVIEGAGNFYYLNPSENDAVAFYAGADALCTFLLVPKTIKYFQEAGIAGKADNAVLYPLQHYEQEKIWLDKELINKFYNAAKIEVEKLEKEVYDAFGYVFNLNSPLQVGQAFEKAGIDTGERTESGRMAVGVKVLEKLSEEQKAKIPALGAYVKFKLMGKLLSTYLTPFKKAADTRGFIRAAYKTNEVPSGRLACGADSKNTYYSGINAQSLPKPHVQMEDVLDLGDRNLFSKKDNIIFGYQFIKSKYDENGNHVVPEDSRYIGQVEGMDNHYNVRACITPKLYEDSGDDEYIYCLDPKTSFVETKEFKYAPLFYIIEKLESGNEVHVKTPKGYRKITNYIHSGKKYAYKLVLKNGREIICSKEHSFMTNRGWIKLKDFTENDNVIVDENMFSDVSWLPLYGYEYRYKINVHTGEMLGPDNHGSKFVRKCKPTMNTHGYVQYNISKPGQKLKSRTRGYRVHKAIIESYYESSKPFGFQVVDHIDSNKENNTIKNLQVGDNGYNLNKYSTKMKFKNGNKNPNAKHWNHYHDKIQTIVDTADRLGGFTKNLSRLISKKYGVSESYSYWIRRKRNKKENILLFKDDSNIECIIDLNYQIDMVDIEVEDEHCFYCNSILTHNCSFDYAAEELRITANVSKEPVWTKAFLGNHDVHELTAKNIWSPELYNRDYRKKAKVANFGILYGMSAKALFENPVFGFKDMQEAETFYEDYKKALPTLFQWQDRVKARAKRDGEVHTPFGRPRRIRGYYKQKKIGFANRTAVNTMIQGAGGDILKIVMCKLWKRLFNNPKYKDDIAWRVAIHDEIGYTIRVSKLKEILPIIQDTQTFVAPQWPIPILTDPSIGWSMGHVYDFEKVDLESGDYTYKPCLV